MIVHTTVYDHGPDHAGTVAELVNGKVWCDQAGKYVELSDPAGATA